jgi:hypothetical protein
MESTHLKIVTPGEAPSQGAESPAEKIRRLQAEIKAAASDELHELECAMDQLKEVSQSIVDAGEAFPPGVREICRGFVEELTAQRQSVSVLMKRAAD